MLEAWPLNIMEDKRYKAKKMHLMMYLSYKRPFFEVKDLGLPAADSPCNVGRLIDD